MTNAKATVAFPSGLDAHSKQKLKAFLVRERKFIDFEFQDDLDETQPTVVSLELPTEGHFGSINGRTDLAAIAQASGLQGELTAEYLRIRKSDDS